MKKIVLIDDNSHGQRAHYGASFVDDEVYADCLQHIEKVNGETDFSFIKDAACVMVHKTLEDFDGVNFLENANKAVEKIEIKLDELKELEGIDIPLVRFTDGHTMPADWKEETPNVVSAIKKSEFYCHLRPFLDEYRKSGEVDLRIIAFGENYKRRQMEIWYGEIISKLKNFKGTVSDSEYMIDRSALQNFIENADLEVSYDFVKDKISKGTYTVKELKEKLDNIMNSIISYGKNICPWE